MKTTVIYHRADFDGLFCREIARKFLPEAFLIGWDFGDPPLSIPDGNIYILDLPVDRVFGAQFTKIGEGLPLCVWPPKGDSKEAQDAAIDGCIRFDKALPNIIWIDHHKSSIETHPQNITGYRMDGVAACRLAWQWFTIVDGNTPRIGAEIGIPIRPAGVLPMIQDYKQRTVNEPLAVRLAGEYDIWDKRDPYAELLQFGLRSEPLTPEIWEALLNSDPKFLPARDVVDRLLEQGIMLRYVRDNEYREVIQSQGFDVKFEGLTFLACCSHELDIRSQLFEAGIQDHHDALMGFTYTGHDWRVSLYHAPNNEHHDLSLIAAKYGGGGHRGACGFRMKETPPWLNAPQSQQ